MSRGLKMLSLALLVTLDLRFNAGGYDAASMAIASRFTDVERVAFTKKARAGAGFTPSREYRFAPAGARRFTRPVYLLTSSLTASAAEIFTMSMSALPHVTVVGERTDGSPAPGASSAP